MSQSKVIVQKSHKNFFRALQNVNVGVTTFEHINFSTLMPVFKNTQEKKYLNVPLEKNDR